MDFFDKKEEVLDLQLTQYGKLLLSKGVFKPVYYAFFDDGIIYDAKAGGVDEHVNDSQDRIKEAPYGKSQYAFHGVETHYKAENKRLASTSVNNADKLNILPSPYERFNALRYSLSNSSLGIDTVPLITARMLQGKLENEELTYHVGSMSPLPVPQLTANVEYEIRQTPPSNDFAPNEGQYSNEIIINQDLLDSEIVFFDGTKISVNGSGLFMEFLEENSPYNEENFEIEVYEVIPAEDTNNDGTKDKPEELLPLYFSSSESSAEHLVSSYFKY